MNDEELDPTLSEGENLDDETDGLDEGLESGAASTQPTAGDELPEKYRNKSATDIIKMHQEAEKALGRQGAEVGELRRVVDEFIRRQFDSSTSKAGQVPAVTEEPDFFREPEKAVKTIVENDPRFRELQEQTEALRREASLARLQKAHPDCFDLVADEDFQTWVGKSKIRTGLMAKADAQFDFDAADELFSTYKELKGKKVDAPAASDSATSVDNGTRRAGQTLPHGRVTPTDTSMGTKGKIWKRRQVIEIMKDPIKHAQYAEEIKQAYFEGRVR